MFKILKTFYKYILKKRFWAVLFFISLIVRPIAISIEPYFYKLFIDAIPSLDYHRLFQILLIYIAVRASSFVFVALSYFIGDTLVVDGFIKIKEDVFKHLQDLDFAFHTNKSSGSLISAIKRGDGALWGIHQSIHFRFFEVGISFLVMLYFFQTLDMRIFFIAIASFVLSLIVALLFVKYNVSFRSEANKKEDKITGVVVDNMVNFETVKLFAKEVSERLRLHKKLEGFKKSVWKFLLSFRALDGAMTVVINGSIFLMLFLSLKLTISGKFSVGDFVLVVGFAATFYPRIFELVWGLRDIARNYSDVEKYFGLLDQKVQIKDPAQPIKVKTINGEINFENVWFAYEKDKQNALRGINLKIRQGQSIALVGRSGAGKTTIIKLLMRFYDVNKGEIMIDGINVKKFKKSDLRGFMGIVPQEPILFNNTIGYNIAYGKKGATKKEIMAASKLARIHDFILTLPKKYNTQVGERGIKLSGGQKQRVAIARMILSDPEIVIFDEATSQLDSESERLIQEAFWKAREDKTTIIIAHRLSTVMRADKIVVLENGKIVEIGTHQDLLQRKDSLYKHFWELQLRD